MDWLKKLLEGKEGIGLSASAMLSLFVFLGNVAAALSDGVIDTSEFHNLLASASGAQMVILLVVMVFLKIRK